MVGIRFQSEPLGSSLRAPCVRVVTHGRNDERRSERLRLLRDDRKCVTVFHTWKLSTAWFSRGRVLEEFAEPNEERRKH